MIQVILQKIEKKMISGWQQFFWQQNIPSGPQLGKKIVHQCESVRIFHNLKSSLLKHKEKEGQKERLVGSILLEILGRSGVKTLSSVCKNVCI